MAALGPLAMGALLLGIFIPIPVSLILMARSNEKYQIGDLGGARTAGKAARIFAIISVVIVVLFVLFVVVVGVYAAGQSSSSSY